LQNKTKEETGVSLYENYRISNFELKESREIGISIPNPYVVYNFRNKIIFEKLVGNKIVSVKYKIISTIGLMHFRAFFCKDKRGKDVTFFYSVKKQILFLFPPKYLSHGVVYSSEPLYVGTQKTQKITHKEMVQKEYDLLIYSVSNLQENIDISQIALDKEVELVKILEVDLVKIFEEELEKEVIKLSTIYSDNIDSPLMGLVIMEGLLSKVESIELKASEIAYTSGMTKEYILSLIHTAYKNIHKKYFKE
jgi:hypothetical protein